MIFFSYWTDFSYFHLKVVLQNLQNMINKGVNGDLLKVGALLFQVFFIDFYLFYFLSGFIPEIYVYCILSRKI